MVTCRPYLTDVRGRQKKGRAPKKDKETLEVQIYILNMSKTADASRECTKHKSVTFLSSNLCQELTICAKVWLKRALQEWQ